MNTNKKDSNRGLKKWNRSLFTLSLAVLVHSSSVIGSTSLDRVTASLEQEIQRGGYSQTRIEIIGPIRWVKGDAPERLQSISLIEDDASGNVHFIARGETDVAEGWASFAAWTQAYVANRRIMPFEKLSQELFSVQQVNMAQGKFREMRGIVLSQSTRISKLETIQTVLEGQFLVSPAVRQVPDVKRGEPVRIRLISGSLTLSTQGVAEESGYVSKALHVMTLAQKRQLLGKLKEGGIVEVNL